jgi:hypothetical protein
MDVHGLNVRIFKRQPQSPALTAQSMLGSLSVYRRVLNDNFTYIEPVGAGQTPRAWTCGGRDHGGLDRVVHCCTRGARQGAPANTICCRQEQAVIQRANRLSFQDLSRPRLSRSISWSQRDASLPHVLLLLVGHIRLVHASTTEAYQLVDTGSEFLGRWTVGTSLLDHELPVRCCEAANYDGSSRAREEVSEVEGRSESNIQRDWLERILARFRAVFPAGFPSERHGAGCI